MCSMCLLKPAYMERILWMPSNHFHSFDFNLIQLFDTFCMSTNAPRLPYGVLEALALRRYDRQVILFYHNLHALNISNDVRLSSEFRIFVACLFLFFFLSKRPKVKSPSRYCEGDDPEKWFRLSLSFFFRFFFCFVRRLWPIQSDYCMGFLDNKGETTKFARTNDKMLMFEWCFLCAQISRKYSVLLRHTHTRARDISFCSQYLVRLMSGNQNSWPKYFP